MNEFLSLWLNILRLEWNVWLKLHRWAFRATQPWIGGFGAVLVLLLAYAGLGGSLFVLALLWAVQFESGNGVFNNAFWPLLGFVGGSSFAFSVVMVITGCFSRQAPCKSQII